MAQGNGDTNQTQELPNDTAFAHTMAQYHALVTERNTLQKRVFELENTITGYKVAFDAHEAKLNDMHSQVQTMMLVRDQAIADRAVYETLFISFQAQLRAFQVPAAPLIKVREESADAAPIAGA